MAYVLADLLVALVGLAALLLAIPVRVRASGSVSSRSLLEESLDNGARLVFRIAGKGDPGPHDGVVPVDAAFDLLAAYGIVAVEMVAGGKPVLRVAGLRFRLGASKRAGEGADRGRSRQADRQKGKQSRQSRGFSLAEARKWLAPGVRGKALRTLKALVRALHLSADLEIECGLPDPGYTGMAYAAYLALSGIDAFRGVTFRPNFQEEVFDARGTVEARIVAIQIGWIAGRFLLSRDIRPLWRSRRTSESAGEPGKPAVQGSPGGEQVGDPRQAERFRGRGIRRAESPRTRRKEK